jgi:hypothetical protein
MEKQKSRPGALSLDHFWNQAFLSISKFPSRPSNIRTRPISPGSKNQATIEFLRIHQIFYFFFRRVLSKVKALPPLVTPSEVHSEPAFLNTDSS